MDLNLIESPSIKDKQQLDGLVSGYNRTQVEGFGYQEFLYTISDNQNTLIAGVHCEVGNGWLYVINLWVAESSRQQGLGKKLLLASENKARELGCHGSYLYTYTFQAPGFYKKYGYEVFGELENFGEKQAKLYMKKRLD
jgi:ribosomal protein S18 acetylase RimI-like enzyme